MDELREYVRGVLKEGFQDIIEVIVRMRVKIQGPGTRTLRDIMTDIRGLIKVITVEQIGRISDRDIDGRAFVAVNIKFEDSEDYHVADMLRDVNGLPDVDMIRLLRIEDPRNKEG